VGQLQGSREAAVACSVTLGNRRRRLPAPHQRQAVRLVKQQPEETVEAASLALLLSQRKRAEAIFLEQQLRHPHLLVTCSERHHRPRPLPLRHKLLHLQLALLGLAVCLVRPSLPRQLHLLRLVVCSVLLGLLKVRQRNRCSLWLLPLQPALRLQVLLNRHHLTCLVNKLLPRQLNRVRPPTSLLAPPAHNRGLLVVYSAMLPPQAHRQRLPRPQLATFLELPLLQPPLQPQTTAAAQPLAVSCSEPRSQRLRPPPLRVDYLALLLLPPRSQLLLRRLLLQLPPLPICLVQSRRIRRAQPAP
jgi:hypothetical protein